MVVVQCGVGQRTVELDSGQTGLRRLVSRWWDFELFIIEGR